MPTKNRPQDMLSRGTEVIFTNGGENPPATGHIVKAHPNAGTSGSYEIKIDGGRKITRKAIHVSKV